MSSDLTKNQQFLRDAFKGQFINQELINNYMIDLLISN